MQAHEYFLKRWEAEQPAFLKVLRALPKEQMAYRPHERSTCAGDLAWQLAEEQRGMCELLDKGETRYEPIPRPENGDDIVAAWEKWTGELRDRLKKLDETTSENPATFFVGNDPVWKEPLGGMLWGFLFDMIHHRGQLSAYIRPMGGKVPSIYGPSADDSGS